MLRAILDYRTRSCYSHALTAVEPIKFIVVFIRELFLPFPPLLLDILLHQDAQSIGASHLLEAGSLIDQGSDANLSEGVQ